MSTSGSAWFGAVEAGGTKVLCAVGTGPGDLADIERIDTTTPDETLAIAVEYFRSRRQRRGGLAAIGIASFGPLDLDSASTTFGHLTTTPKPGWAGADIAGAFRRGLGVPVGIDTDVNTAALGEWQHGAGRGLDTIVYITVGTGIGGGAVVHGRTLHGLVHPEMGHVRIPHDLAADPFPGVCPYHGDCLEGLASGPALAARWGRPAETLPADHPAWPLEARYLALALHAVVCTLSPQRIVLGGGVMAQPTLCSLVRRELVALLGGYVRVPELGPDVDRYVVAPALGTRSGLIGALALAQRATAGRLTTG